jgi:hypothetical protein
VKIEFRGSAHAAENSKKSDDDTTYSQFAGCVANMHSLRLGLDQKNLRMSKNSKSRQI